MLGRSYIVNCTAGYTGYDLNTVDASLKWHVHNLFMYLCQKVSIYLYISMCVYLRAWTCTHMEK